MLDFKNFEKVAEDDKTTTLRHPKGHEIRVILKGLRPIEREQIKRLKMAKGGDPIDLEGMSSGPTSMNKTSQDVEDLKSSLPPDDGAESPLAPPQAPAPVPAPSLQSAEPAPIHVPQVPATPPVQNAEGTLNPGGAAQTATSAIDLQSKIDAQAAKAKAHYDQQYLEERQRLAQQDAQNYQEMKAHTDEFANFAKANPINPNLYGESQTGAQKTSTGIGLFLGGLGGQGHSNIALDFLNKQIDRNIEAQRENVNNQKSVWSAYHDLYGSATIANNLAKVSANDMLTHQVDLTAAQLGTPQAAQKAMQLRSQKAIENSKLLQDSAVDLKNLPGHQELNQGPLSSAASPMGGATASNAPVSGAKTPDSILGPHAEQHFKELAYTPKAKENYGAIQSQYNNAVQADKALAQIDDTFDRLNKNVEEGSVGGNIRRRGAHAVAGIPLGIGQALSGSLNYLTDTDANKAYDSNQSNLLGYVSSALKGTNIGGGQIEDIVEKNSPERGDSPELAEQKKQAIKDFIKNHTDTSLLKAWNLTK